MLQQFLRNQLYPNNPPQYFRPFHGKISVYPSALATFYAPSDICGTGGMRRERIRAVESWRKGPGRYDCAFISTDPSAEGMRSLDIGRVRLFFSFGYNNTIYPCALICWYSRVTDKPDEDTGMWVVEPESNADGSPWMAIVHLDTLVCGAHLIGVYGDKYVPKKLTFNDSLNAFHTYYVNKFIDNHAFEIAF
jgi:hypothetical protein